MIVHYYKAPVGYLKLQVSSKGVKRVEFVDKSGMDEREDRHASSIERNADLKKGGSNANDAEEILDKCVQWLDSYFAGNVDHVQPLPPLDIEHKSEFYNQVWKTLISTHPGETLSYAELAARSGRPGTARATGQAVKKHKLPILIPCHRVVKSGGKGIGNYSGGHGTSTKRWLLEHEKTMTMK